MKHREKYWIRSARNKLLGPLEQFGYLDMNDRQENNVLRRDNSYGTLNDIDEKFCDSALSHKNNFKENFQGLKKKEKQTKIYDWTKGNISVIAKNRNISKTIVQNFHFHGTQIYMRAYMERAMSVNSEGG
ncbi:hypothetical protein WUBG_00970 [Wuchereria bancrofti]|uniref:Uncharacterized protein n=1 Tax=Wuchereria bancrofti TaxID=6293 RepID=J9F0W2_WUCBA|nr:hypothetical protein WUBG_00970 [Wuchereria bancrofti]